MPDFKVHIYQLVARFFGAAVGFLPAASLCQWQLVSKSRQDFAYAD
jgi:hypothetical protein